MHILFLQSSSCSPTIINGASKLPNVPRYFNPSSAGDWHGCTACPDLQQVAALTAPRPGPRHQGGTFNLENYGRGRPGPFQVWAPQKKPGRVRSGPNPLGAALNSAGVSLGAPTARRPTVTCLEGSLADISGGPDGPGHGYVRPGGADISASGWIYPPPGEDISAPGAPRSDISPRAL